MSGLPEQVRICLEELNGDSGRNLLNDIRAAFRRYVDMTNEQNVIVSLWAVHAHLIPVLQFTPYLSITSAERESGKSRVLDILNYLVARPWKTERTSAAALVRKIDSEHPTLLLDEADTAFGGDKDYAEALRGILNSGFCWKGNATICIGQGANLTVKSFSTYGPKAIAGINRLPDTIASRAIPIRLKRARRGRIQKFEERLSEVTGPLHELRTRIEGFVDRIAGEVGSARPTMPEELSDRQADVTFPLLAIADIAGGEWPELARNALVALCASAAVPQSKGEQLLADIRRIFEERGIDRIPSADLAEALGKIEDSPWAEWGKSEKPITAVKMAGLLKPYDIHPHPVRDGQKVFKGYEASDFLDAWDRYLAPIPVEGLRTVTRLQANTSAANEYAGCNRVTDLTPISDAQERDSQPEPRRDRRGDQQRKKLILTTSADLAAFVDGPGQPKSRIADGLERLIFKSEAPETNDGDAPF
jgi:hypothetical protein